MKKLLVNSSRLSTDDLRSDHGGAAGVLGSGLHLSVHLAPDAHVAERALEAVLAARPLEEEEEEEEAMNATGSRCYFKVKKSLHMIQVSIKLPK